MKFNLDFLSSEDIIFQGDVKMKRKILLVDDEEIILKRLSSLLREEKYEVITARTGREVQEIKDEPDVILLDLKLPDTHGLNLIPLLKEKYPFSQIIIISGYGDIEDAVKSIKVGAFDFLEKPINRDKLFVVIKNAIEKKELLEKKNLWEKGGEPPIIGRSAHIKKMKTFINRVADLDAPVLITGETGTGKDLLAKHIHLRSKRRKEKFVMINCSAIPQDLLESELFGYKKGAFSGAVRDKKGKIEEAERGTLFFNEIGEMSPSLQSKLLIFIEEKTFEKLGDTKPKKIETRIIAATNRDLKKEIEKGNFRQDLFFRLNTFSFEILPLRKRREDIIPLIDYYVKIYSMKYGTMDKEFTEDALEYLTEYQWYGNVRELKHFTERIVAIEKRNKIDIKTVKKYLGKEGEMKFLPLREARQRFEKEYISKVIEKAGSLKKASEILKISRMQLYRKMKEYEIEFKE